MRLSLPAFTLVFAGFAVAFDPSTGTTCVSEGICLSSFIWCKRGQDDCFFPKGADAFIPGSPSAPYAVLYHGKKYEITWRQTHEDYPVLIEWLFQREPFQSYAERSTDTLQVMWSTNSTASSYTFDPKAILESFPTLEAPDVSPGLAVAAAQGISNHIRISQPGSGFPPMSSDRFLVHSEWTEQFAKNIRAYDAKAQAQRECDWKLGAGLGLGFGLLAVYSLVWFLMKRQAARYTASSNLVKSPCAESKTSL